MLTFTKFDGVPFYAMPAGIDEVRPGAFSDLGGGCRLILVSGSVVPVMEDFDAVEAVLAEAGLADFGWAEIVRPGDESDGPDCGGFAPRPVVLPPVTVRIDTTGWGHPD